jgi:hypothetical protein
LHEKFVALAGTPDNWRSEVVDCRRKIARYWEMMEYDYRDEAERLAQGDAWEQATEAVFRIVDIPVSRPEHVADKLQVLLEHYVLLDLREEEAPRLVALLGADLSRAATRLREAELA